MRLSANCEDQQLVQAQCRNNSQAYEEVDFSRRGLILSKDEKDWKEKLAGWKASGSLGPVERNTARGSVPNQFKPIGSPAANVRNSAGIAPKENNTESRVTTILEELAKTKTRLSHVEEERSQLRAALNDRNQELDRKSVV